MRSEPYKAVITADVVGSRSVKPAELQRVMTRVTAPIARSFKKAAVSFEFFRGDSFQTVVPAEEALRAALLIRAAMRADGHALDVRIGIGVAGVKYLAKTLGHSNGEAFERSGEAVDALKKNGGRLRINTAHEEWNWQLAKECLLAEGSLRRWTQAVYLALLTGEIQEQLALSLRIAQSSVNRRLARHSLLGKSLPARPSTVPKVRLVDTSLFARLLLAHLLGDFAFQPDRWVENRRARHFRSSFLYLHAAVHFGLAWVATGALSG